MDKVRGTCRERVEKAEQSAREDVEKAVSERDQALQELEKELEESNSIREKNAELEQINELEERDRYVLDQRFIIGKTQVELANELGISQAQISRIEKKIIDDLKKEIK